VTAAHGTAGARVRGLARWAVAVDTASATDWATLCRTKWTEQRGVSDPLGPRAGRPSGRNGGVAHAPFRCLMGCAVSLGAAQNAALLHGCAASQVVALQRHCGRGPAGARALARGISDPVAEGHD